MRSNRKNAAAKRGADSRLRHRRSAPPKRHHELEPPESVAGGILPALLAVLVPLLVYLRTMAPTVYGLDSAELTTGAYVLGIVHAPGAPLYLLLAHAFTKLPIGDVGYRVNLFSVVSAAAAVGFVHATLLRLTRDVWASLGAAWLLAFTYYYWISALAAELYALHGLVIAALLWLTLRWREEQRRWQLFTAAALFGLGLGNHLSLIVLAPGMAWLAFSQERRPLLRTLALATLCVVFGAGVYVYLPLRGLAHPPLDFARAFGIDLATWEGFWWMVSGRMFAAKFFAVPVQLLPSELALFLYRLWSNFLGLGALLGAFGLAFGLRRQRPVHVGLLLLFLGHLIFMLTYNVEDKELMLGPAYLLWGLWVGVAAGPVASALASRVRPGASAAGRALPLMLAAMALVVNFRLADISGDWSARQRGERIFGGLPPASVFIGTWADVPILEYLQLVEGQRPDVETVNLFFWRGDRRLRLIQERLASQRPVYTSSPRRLLQAAGWLGFEHLEACQCYRVDPTGARSPAPAGLP
jgi:hypothetical protein